MNRTRRYFVQTLFAAGQLSLLGRLLAVNAPTETEAEAPALNFLVFGDWGVNGDANQTQVARQMAQVARTTNPAFLLAVGDNFYEVGVKDIRDPQWQTSFEEVYSDKALQIPCYAILGNHDYCGNCEAQIEYGQSHPRWIMPARYYTQTHPIDATNDVQFFFIDTCPFINEYRVAPSPPSSSALRDSKADDARLNLFRNASAQNVATQIAWLEKELAESQAKWKIVVGHHPIYSGGLHGNQPELEERILPLLRRSGVHVYFCGHDHDLQHLQADGINFFCSGAAGAKLYPLHGTDETKFAQSSFGFMSIALTSTVLKAKLINDAGTVLYETTVPQVIG